MKNKLKNKIKDWYVPLEPENSTDHLDLSKMRLAPPMPNLKFSTTTMNLRVPLSLLSQLKMIANQRDVPYQSLVKMILFDAVEKFQKKAA